MKRLIFGILLSNFIHLAQAQIGLNTGEKTLLVSKMTVQAVPKIDFFLKEKEPISTDNLVPTWSFSESNVYDTHFGFFCKVEVKLDKIAKVPMRFRLGSVDYVNGLEGK